MIEPGRRATNLEEMRVIRGRADSSESVNRGLAYEAQPTDVFIATYPKCGTTWLQQILHTLRTGGDLDFAEITADHAMRRPARSLSNAPAWLPPPTAGSP